MDTIHGQLRPIRRRQQLQFSLHCAAWGLLAGAALAIVASLARISGLALTPWASPGLCVAGVMVGFIVGMFWPRSWLAAARAVDARYQLKDRTATALAFVESQAAGQIHALQIADAVEHLQTVRSHEAVPWRLPRPAPYSIAAVCLALALLLAPNSRDRAEAGPAAPLAAIVQEAEVLEESLLPELKELAAEANDPKLQELLVEVQQLVEQMKEPGVDVRDALATLSQMQAIVAAAQSEFNLAAVDASLKQIGQALSPATAMQAAADAVQQGDYNKAADELEQIDPTQLSKQESRAVGEQLQQAAQKTAEARQARLSKTAKELADAIENKNESQCKGSLCKLAGECRAQALRTAISQCLGCQLAKLGECKSACQANCAKSGGDGVAKSQSPKQTWGVGASGRPLSDEATRIDATLNREDITGTAGDGPSEKEVAHTAEGRQKATREYREKYAAYRRANEAVLESEALPLGHRQTIRKYFESIRPQAEESPGTIEE